MMKLSNLFEGTFGDINITFPKDEHDYVIKRLDSNGTAITTRFKKDFGKYKLNNIRMTPWGDLVKIINLQTFNDVTKHPYYKDLTTDQIEKIKKNGNYEVLTLKKL